MLSTVFLQEWFAQWLAVLFQYRHGHRLGLSQYWHAPAIVKAVTNPHRFGIATWQENAGTNADGHSQVLPSILDVLEHLIFAQDNVHCLQSFIS